MKNTITRYVFTGPPCSGKSSVFEGMKYRFAAFMFINEVARNAIKYFKEHEPHKLPQKDHAFFQNYMETKQLQNFLLFDRPKSIDENTPYIYDRGIVDEIGYREYFNMPENPKLKSVTENYRYNKVFYFPLWEEIYKPDAERTETLDEAKKIDACVRKAYQNAGYELIEVPFDTVENRIEFIVKNIF